MRMKLGFAMKYVAAGVLTVGLGVMAGCADGAAAGTNTPPVTPGVPAKSVVVTNYSSTANAGQILVYSAASAGTTTPSATITLPTVTLTGGYTAQVQVESVATDSTGQIYVGASIGRPADTNPTEILVYAAGASGTATPIRTITPVSGSFFYVGGMQVDAAGNLYVASSNSYYYSTTKGGAIVVYSATANGAATPTRVISGSNTGFAVTSPSALTVDASGTIYVSNEPTSTIPPQIVAFSSTATGNVAPVRTISGANTGLAGYYFVSQLAVDGAGNVYVGVTNGFNAIEVFGSMATGNVAPTRTITGAATGFHLTEGVAVDGAGNVYVSTFDSTQTIPAISVFSATANGNVAPTATFTSTAWTLPSNSIAIF